MKNGLKIKGPSMFHGDGKPSPVMQVGQKTGEGKFSIQPKRGVRITSLVSSASRLQYTKTRKYN
jgi:hypothetical protein